MSDAHLVRRSAIAQPTHQHCLGLQDEMWCPLNTSTPGGGVLRVCVGSLKLPITIPPHETRGTTHSDAVGKALGMG